jgi:YggT family protein
MGGLDLAPLVVLIGVAVARIVLVNNAAAFY